MILFHVSNYEGMAKLLREKTGAQQGFFSTARFSNGELSLKLESEVEGKDCYVLGSISPPDEQLFSMLQLADGMRRYHAKTITMIFLYFSYARHDKLVQGKTLTFLLMGELFKAAGVNRVVTLEIHNPSMAKDFATQLISLSAAPLFSKVLKTENLTAATLVAPDKGALPRCEAVRKETAMSNEIICFKKQRTESGVVIDLEGKPAKANVIIDDILDTGGTLVLASEALVKKGAERNIVLVTHGLFTGDYWQKLWSLHVERIYTTDSVPSLGPGRDARIRIISVVPLLLDFFATRSPGEN